MKPRISVVINTFNEEKNLPYALRSVRTWADEIIVVDMHSEDRTVEIAREYGAKVFLFERVGFVEPARAFAVEQTTCEWIFILDADEVIPQPLSVKLLEIAEQDTADIVSIAWLNYLLGDPILHTGWGPYQDRHARFFKKGKLTFNAKVHAGIHPILGVRMFHLPYSEVFSIHHFCYFDMEHFIYKLNKYTSIEAQQAFERKEKAGYLRMLVVASREFLARYIRSEGYKDGWRGFYFSLLMVFYRVTIFAKLKGLYMGCDLQSVRNKYNDMEEKILSEYPS